MNILLSTIVSFMTITTNQNADSLSVKSEQDSIVLTTLENKNQSISDSCNNNEQTVISISKRGNSVHFKFQDGNNNSSFSYSGSDFGNCDTIFKKENLLVINDNNYFPYLRKSHSHLCGFYYGFVNTYGNNYARYDHTDTNWEGFMDMDWSESFMMSFNIIQSSVPLNKSKRTRAVVGMGLDYYRYKLSKNNISFTNNNGEITPYYINEEKYPNIRRSTFKTLYLSIPICLEFNFPVKQNHNIWTSVGVTNSFKIHSKTKIVYDDGKKRKEKNSDSFNMNPYKADIVAKIGFDDICIWGNYTLTNLFQHNKGPEIAPYVIGIGFIFGD